MSASARDGGGEPSNHAMEFTALLGKGASFEGRLVFEGVVRIDGRFKGDIFTRDTLIVGAESRVEAQIDADTIIVAGYIEGEIRATSRIEIQSTGYIRGSIQAPIFKIEEGGMFDGTTQMLPTEST
jgi:cytoskeletal protein CcmA (bactofilin family)